MRNFTVPNIIGVEEIENSFTPQLKQLFHRFKFYL